MNRRHQSPLNERHKLQGFEAMLAEISARFVNLPATQVDTQIEKIQRRACEFLGMDLSALWPRSAETPGSFTLTHLCRHLDGPPTPERMDAQEHFPWRLQQLMTSKVIARSFPNIYRLE